MVIHHLLSGMILQVDVVSQKVWGTPFVRRVQLLLGLALERSPLQPCAEVMFERLNVLCQWNGCFDASPQKDVKRLIEKKRKSREHQLHGESDPEKRQGNEERGEVKRVGT